MKLLTTTLSVAALLATFGVANAVQPLGNDLCVTFNNVPVTYEQVLPGGWPLPRAGKVAAWNGFTPQNGVASPSTGTLDLSTDGKKLTISFETQELGVVFWDKVQAPVTSLNGRATEIQIGGALETGNGQPFNVPSVTVARCVALGIPSGDDEGSPQAMAVNARTVANDGAVHIGAK